MSMANNLCRLGQGFQWERQNTIIFKIHSEENIAAEAESVQEKREASIRRRLQQLGAIYAEIS